MRLVLLSLLLWPLAGHTAPVLVAAGMTAATAATVVAVAQVVMFVGSLIYGAAQQRKAKRQAEEAERARRDAYNATLQDRTVTTVSTAQPFRYVYGRARVGSAVVAVLTSGDRDQFQHLVCVHAAHECDAFEEIYVGGKALGALDSQGRVTSGDYFKTTSGYYGSGWLNTSAFSLPEGFDASSIIVSYGQLTGGDGEGTSGSFPTATFSIAGSTLTVTSGEAPFYMECRYTQNTSTVRVQKHLGTPDDPVDAYLHGLLPAKWPATSVLRGFTYTVITLDLNQPEFQGGIPDIEVLLRGKKLYDVRAGTTAWSQTNALVAYDYLTSEMCGMSAADLPLADFIAAANACDESTAYGPLYTFNGDVTADQSQQKVLEKMAQSMAGGIVSTTWSIYAGKYTAPVMALQQSDIVGAFSVTPGVADADLYNGVRGQFISSESNYVPTDFKPYQNTTYRAADGDDMWTDIEFPYTDSTQRVHNLARIYTEDQRNGYTVKGDFKLKAWDRKVGERVAFTSAFYGWSSKVFRITDKVFTPNKSAVTLTLKEDAASIWDLEDAVEVDSTPNSDLPNPFFAEPITGLTCTSGTEALQLQADGTVVSRILMQWDAPAAQSVYDNGEIEIQWKKVGSDVWQKDTVAGDVAQRYLSPVEELATYIVRTRSVAPYLNVRSDWAYSTHLVIGKTQPPTQIEGVAVTQQFAYFPKVADKDLAGYQVRALPGEHGADQLSLAVPLHEGLITDSPYRFAQRLQGVQTIFVAAVDTSGNVGLPGLDTLDFGVEDPLNVAQEVDFSGAGWPGALVNCEVAGGEILADVEPSSDFWAIGGESFWVRDNASDFWGGTNYLAMTYMARFAPTYGGGTVIIETTMAGSRGSIQWQRDGGATGDYWAPDSSDFWSGYDSVYGASGTLQPYLGGIPSVESQGILVQISIDGGPQQGEISAMAARLQMPDRDQIFTGLSISAAGTRLDPAVGVPAIDWIEIEEVLFTVATDGSGAIAGRVLEFDPVLGPLVEFIDSAGNPVNCTGQAARVRGF
jgi:hypothetical protein